MVGWIAAYSTTVQEFQEPTLATAAMDPTVAL
jgi:hypothetical protein